MKCINTGAAITSGSHALLIWLSSARIAYKYDKQRDQTILNCTPTVTFKQPAAMTSSSSSLTLWLSSLSIDYKYDKQREQAIIN